MYFHLFCIHVYASKGDFDTFTIVTQKVKKKLFQTNHWWAALFFWGVRFR
jgi:hypothetical protein